MPQKRTTTTCFIQEESSGGRPGCSGKFLRHFMTILSVCYWANQNYLVVFVFRKPTTDCFDIIIRKNKWSCTHWKLIVTSYKSHEYKTLLSYISLIRSIQYLNGIPILYTHFGFSLIWRRVNLEVEVG